MIIVYPFSEIKHMGVNEKVFDRFHFQSEQPMEARPPIAVLINPLHRSLQNDGQDLALQVQHRVAEQVVHFGGQVFRGRQGQGIRQSQDPVFLGIQEVQIGGYGALVAMQNFP